MAHRDELAAARAHIEALQRRVKELEAGDGRALAAMSLRAERDRLAEEVARLQRELDDDDAATPPRASPIPTIHARDDETEEQRVMALPTLYEHNRSFPPWHGQPGAGVSCPACAEEGDRVELITSVRPVRAASPEAEALADDVAGVSCPRCGFLGMKRTR